jgi:hypothetical protein
LLRQRDDAFVQAVEDDQRAALPHRADDHLRGDRATAFTFPVAFDHLGQNGFQSGFTFEIVVLEVDEDDRRDGGVFRTAAVHLMGQHHEGGGLADAGFPQHRAERRGLRGEEPVDEIVHGGSPVL